MKRIQEISITIAVISLLTSCNSPAPTIGEKSDSTSAFAAKPNAAKIILNKYTPDELRMELLARSEFGYKGDSLFKLGTKDTLKPTFRIPELNKLTNDDILSEYQQKLIERKEITVIYAKDNRKNIADVGDSAIQEKALSVVAFIPKKRMKKNSDGFYQLIPEGNYKDLYDLCGDKKEQFLTEQVCADCSGFAISANLIASAGHCLRDKKKVNEYYVVFDYRLENMPKFTSTGIPDNLVYEITQILENPRGDADYSVSRVNKPIPSSRVVQTSASNHFSDQTNFYVLGFPCGLPMKYTNESSLRSDKNKNFFVIDSDTYGGNSGSPVFNSTTNLVEGILVRGNDDFYVQTGSPCNTSIICGHNDCRGEDVTRIAFLNKYLK